ncbi:MAG: SNF2 helicase associated domain-containing protein [Lachnospiraceae bacterium]
MIKKSEIKNLTTDITYKKGVELFHKDNFVDFTVDNEGDWDEISAILENNGKSYCEVTATYDLEADIIEECKCSCREFYNEVGLCKHCVATLLEYEDYFIRKEMHSTYLSGKEEAIQKLKKINKGILKQTTPEVKYLLEQKVMKRTFPLEYKNICKTVKIEPFLYLNMDIYNEATFFIEFKLGTSQMYVLKDVFEFAENMKQMKEHNYGKKLGFIHALEAFEEKSQPFATFICEWANSHKRDFEEPSYSYGYGYTNTPSKLRSIPLNEKYIGQILDLLKEREFTAGIDDVEEKKWQISSEKIKKKLYITGNKDGISVRMQEIMTCICSSEVLYFFEKRIYRIPKEELEPILDFMNCMVTEPGNKVFIQKEDVPVFCRELLPILQQTFDCELKQFEETDYGVLPVSFRIYLDAPQKDFITCKTIAAYGKTDYSVYDKSTDMLKRDMVREAEVAELVSSYCNAYDEKEKQMVISEDEDLLYELLTEGIARLQQEAEVYVSEQLKRMQVMDTPKVSIGVSLSGDLLQLNLTAGEMPKEQLIEILSKYNRKKKFYRLKNGEFIHMDEENMGVLLELKHGLRLSDKDLRQNEIAIPKYRALYLDGELRGSQNVKTTKDKNFKALIRNMKTIEDNDFEIPKNLENVLREYQKRGFLWIKTLQYNGFGGILADDMGLGKTLQVIAFLLSEYETAQEGQERRTLIICPASLVYNWKNEMNMFAPHLPVKMVIGTAKEREEIINHASPQEILVTSYDLLKRDLTLYEGIHFYCEVIDEAQYIKNHSTQTAKAVKGIEAGFRLALTGTPVENRLSELWSIFDYVMSGFLFGYEKFREEFEAPIVQENDETALNRLRKMITPFVLRRLKQEVLQDLPDKLEENRYVELEGEQQKLYDAHVKRMQMLLDEKSDEEFKGSKIQILAELTKLRQLCCDPSLLFQDYKASSAKSDLCIEMIKNAVEGGHKILLFSQFTTMLEHLQERLQQEKISYYVLTGAVNKEKRAKLVANFNKDDTSVFCISLKAGGTGLNLTAADIVIHFDPWWNLAVQNQATDRAHRIGQKNVVNVYKLITKGTIEENIVKLQERKRELADKILTGEGFSGASFTKDELLELLG